MLIVAGDPPRVPRNASYGRLGEARRSTRRPKYRDDVIRHVVLLTFLDGTPTERIDEIADALRSLPAAIPELQRYVVGKDLGLAADNADLVVVADVDDIDGYAAYRDHPAHMHVITALIRPVLAVRTAVQHEL